MKPFESRSRSCSFRCFSLGFNGFLASFESPEATAGRLLYAVVDAGALAYFVWAGVTMARSSRKPDCGGPRSASAASKLSTGYRVNGGTNRMKCGNDRGLRSV